MSLPPPPSFPPPLSPFPPHPSLPLPLPQEWHAKLLHSILSLDQLLSSLKLLRLFRLFMTRWMPFARTVCLSAIVRPHPIPGSASTWKMEAPLLWNRMTHVGPSTSLHTCAEALLASGPKQVATLSPLQERRLLSFSISFQRPLPPKTVGSKRHFRALSSCTEEPVIQRSGVLSSLSVVRQKPSSHLLVDTWLWIPPLKTGVTLPALRFYDLLSVALETNLPIYLSLN